MMKKGIFLIMVAVILIVVGGIIFVSPEIQPPEPSRSPVHVSILAINDFHGHLSAGKQLNNRSAGSAPALASYLKSAMDSSRASYTFLALTGDTVGASPRSTALLMDEPTILFFNTFAGPDCAAGDAARHNRCNVIAVPGNHEFNRGVEEFLRMTYGGNGTVAIPRIADPYPGALADTICANVVWKENGTPVLPPYTVRDAGGAMVAFIGAVTTETTILELPVNIRDVDFLNETEAINTYVTILQDQGIHTFVILLHEGGMQEPYDGQTRKGGNVTGPVVSIIAGLDPDVDIVLTAHSHRFTNAYLPNSGGNDVLVVQAYSYGMAYADVDLRIDPVTGEIVSKSAVIVLVYADPDSGVGPYPDAEAFLTEVEGAVTLMTNEVIATSATDITRTRNTAGESALGDLVADSQRVATGADVAFVATGNPAGALHADLPRGNITWGDLENILPADASMAAEYGGWYSRPRIATRNLTGEQIRQILEKQFVTPAPNETLSVSGLTYMYDPSQPAGEKVKEILINGSPVDASATYTTAMNYYLAYGMGGAYSPPWDWSVNVAIGPADIDALEAYLRSLPEPLEVQADGRVRRAV